MKNLVYTVVAGAMLVGGYAHAGDGSVLPPSTAEILAQAPVFQLLLDASGSSPATDTQFMAAASVRVAAKIKAMPLGTKVIIVSFGDASKTPINVSTRLQAKPSREGSTPDAVARQVTELLLKFPRRAPMDGETHAIGALYDASTNINRNARHENVVMVLSDLIENSGPMMANCYQDCRLPKPTFSLPNTNVEVLGAGRGLPSNREIALHTSWAGFLEKTGAKYSLKRTF